MREVQPGTRQAGKEQTQVVLTPIQVPLELCRKDHNWFGDLSLRVISRSFVAPGAFAKTFDHIREGTKP